MENTLSIINNINEIEKIESFLEELVSEEFIPSRLKFNLNLVLEEILTNIIFYGYEDEEEHLIKVIITLKDRELTIKVLDDGKPFNPIDLEEPDLEKPIEEREIGGLGIHLVKNIVKSIDYVRDGNNNILSMKMDTTPS